MESMNPLYLLWGFFLWLFGMFCGASIFDAAQ
jgi:hypothetical protein